LSRPLPESEKFAQLSVTLPSPGVADNDPLMGAVRSRIIDAEVIADTLPAASLYQTYTVFGPSAVKAKV
jgi:hypothetical protein